MSVANSGIFTIVNAVQVELAELAASIPAAVNLDAINTEIAALNTEVAALQTTVNTCSLYTQVVRQVQYSQTTATTEIVTSMGSVSPGIYAMSGTVNAVVSGGFQGLQSYLTQGDINDDSDIQIAYSRNYLFLTGTSTAAGLVVPMSGYITVTDPSEILHRVTIVGNSNNSSNTFIVNIQLTRVNQVPA